MKEATPADNADSADAVRPEEWRKIADNFKNSEDPVERTEALLRGRLYYLSLPTDKKVEYYDTLSLLYRNFFNIDRENDPPEFEENLTETFEEAVEDWAGLNDALDNFIGLEEDEESKTKRLNDNEARCNTMFSELNPDVAKKFLEHVGTGDFKTFLKKEFGNTDIIEYLKDNEEMKDAVANLKEEDEENPFFDETIDILKKVLESRVQQHGQPVIDLKSTAQTNPLIKTLNDVLKQCKASGNYGMVKDYLSQLDIPRANLKTLPDSINEIQETLRRIFEESKDETMRLLYFAVKDRDKL